MTRATTRRLGALAAAGLLLSACASYPTVPRSSSPSASASFTPSPQALGIPVPQNLLRPGVITFLSDTTYPPQESIDPATNKPVGFDVDIAQAIAAKIGAAPGLRAEIKPEDFLTIVPSLLARRGDAIISAMRITPELQQKVAFVGYFQAGQAILVRKGNPLEIHGLADLCGKKVAVQVSTNEQATLAASNANQCKSNKINIQVFPTDTEAVLKLQLGMVDAAMDDSPVVAYYAQQKPEFFEITGPLVQSAVEGIAVDRKNTELLKAIQQAMLALYGDGTYRRLLVKWNLLDGEIPVSQIVISQGSGSS